MHILGLAVGGPRLCGTAEVALLQLRVAGTHRPDAQYGLSELPRCFRYLGHRQYPPNSGDVRYCEHLELSPNV